MPYFSLEFCTGGSLDKKLKENPLPARAAAELVEKLARGMAVAHEKGVVHRDLKPANVLLSKDGIPKITDFGLAKTIGDNFSPLRQRGDLTHTGAIMGTPSYMAPEQASGEAKSVGPAADIYALGTILYEALTGRPPFKGASVLETLDQVRKQEPVSPRQLNERVPRDFETICLMCLRKEAGNRYASASELAKDLRQFVEGRPIMARPVGRVERVVKLARRRPVEAGLVAAIFLLLLTATSVIYAKYREAKHNERIAIEKTAIATRETARADSEAKEATEQAERANENAAKWADELKEARRVLDLARLREAQTAFDNNLVQLARDTLAEIAPENRCVLWRILNRRFEGGVYAIYRLTGPVNCVSLSADGGLIATASGSSTNLWDARTGQHLRDFKVGKYGASSLVLCPDGSKLLTASDKGVHLWDARTGQLMMELEGHAAQIKKVAVSMDGKCLATASDQSVRVWDAHTGRTIKEISFQNQVLIDLALSADGTRLAVKCWDRRKVLV